MFNSTINPTSPSSDSDHSTHNGHASTVSFHEPNESDLEHDDLQAVTQSSTPQASAEPLLATTLYSGSRISEGTGKLLLQSLASKYGLTKSAVDDIL